MNTEQQVPQCFEASPVPASIAPAPAPEPVLPVITSFAALTNRFQRAPQLVTVPGVGKVYMRKLSVGEITEWQASLVGLDLKPTREGLFQADASMAARAVCSPDGMPLFTLAQALSDLDPGDVSRLGKAARAHNSVKIADEDKIEGN